MPDLLSQAMRHSWRCLFRSSCWRPADACASCFSVFCTFTELAVCSLPQALRILKELVAASDATLPAVQGGGCIAALVATLNAATGGGTGCASRNSSGGSASDLVRSLQEVG